MGWMDAPEVGNSKWQSAPEAGPPVIATTADGGKIYRMSDGSLSYAGDGMATNNQETIAKLMEGATPAEASAYGNVNTGGRLMSAVRSGYQGATFGAGDEITSYLGSLAGSGDYDSLLAAERARLEKGRDQYPVTTTAAEIGGAVAVPVGGIAGGGSKVAQVGKSIATGAALGGAYGFNTGEGGLKDRSENALSGAGWGALFGAAAPAIGGVAEKIMNGIKTNAAIKKAAQNAPTTEELRRMGDAAYKAVDDAGVVISPDAMQTAADDIVSRMRAAGMDTGPMSLTPKSARVADIAAETAGAGKPVPFSELDLLRRKAAAPASDVANRLEASVGSQGISALDDFVNNLGPSQLVAGNADDLPQLIGQARDIWAKMRRSDLIDTAIERSQDYLSGGASGIRNQFANILRNPKLSRGFSEAEKEAMRRVINGSIPERLLHLVGGGMGQLTTLGAGAGLGGLPGMAVAAGIAAGARKASENVALKNAEVVRALIANGGLSSVPRISADTRILLEELVRKGGSAATAQ